MRLLVCTLDGAEDTWLAKTEEWRPETWEARGFERYWGDTDTMSDFFEVLRKSTEHGTQFVILCPTFLRRPFVINTNDPDAWVRF